MKTFGKLANKILLVIMLLSAGSLMACGQQPVTDDSQSAIDNSQPITNDSQPVIDDFENPQYLFTMSATSGSFEDGKLTLSSIPLVVYFTDRPYRTAGHMSLQDFAKMWSEGAESFSKDPPNAELAIYGESGNSHALLIISTPEISGTSISFSVKVLEGDMPETFGHATLFIDPDTVAPSIT